MVLNSLHPKSQLDVYSLSKISGISYLQMKRIINQLYELKCIEVSYKGRGSSKLIRVIRKGQILKWSLRTSCNIIDKQKDRLYIDLEQLVKFSNYEKVVGGKK
jgi:hypothetical protein